MTMTHEQLDALIQYIEATAQRQAVLAAYHSDEGGYFEFEKIREAELRRVFLEHEQR